MSVHLKISCWHDICKQKYKLATEKNNLNIYLPI